MSELRVWSPATRKLRVLYGFVQRVSCALSNHTPRTVKSVWTLARHFGPNLNALVAQWAEFERLDAASVATTTASGANFSEAESFRSQAEYELARDTFRFYVVEALSQAMRLPVSRNSRVLARLQLQLLDEDDRLPFVAKTLNVLRVPRSYEAAQLLWAVARVGDSDPWSGEFALEQGDDCPDRRRQCSAIALDSVRAFPDLGFLDDETWRFLSGNRASTDRFIMVVNGATPLDPATTDCGEYDYSPSKFTEAFAVLEMLDGFLHFRFVTGDEVPALRALLTSSDGEWLFPTSAPVDDEVARGSTIADGNFALLFHRLIFPLDIREARRLHPTESERLRLWEPLYFSAAHWTCYTAASLTGCPVASTHLDKFLFGERDASTPRLEPQIVQPPAAPVDVPVPRLNHQLHERIFGGELEKDAAKSQKLLVESGTLEQFDEAFVIQKYLGALGLSVLATHRETGEQVVVKVIEKPSRSTRDYESDVQRFITYVSKLWAVGKEAYAASLAGEETHVVGVVGVYESSRDVLVVHEYCSGGELFDWLQARDEPITEAAVCDVVRQILLGLSEMHALGLPHGDLKPSNIFVDTRGEPSVRVHLFGCAPLWTANENSMFTAKEFVCQFFSPELTQTIESGANPFVGSHPGAGADGADDDCDDLYVSMPPGRGTSMNPVHEKLSTAADVWAVGTIASLALFGHLPFVAPGNKAPQRVASNADVATARARSVRSDICGFVVDKCELLQRDSVVSKAGRDALTLMLHHVPDCRVTAKEALELPWITGEEEEPPEQPRMKRSQTEASDALPDTKPASVRRLSEQTGRMSRGWSKADVILVQERSDRRKKQLKGFTAVTRFHNQVVIELANKLPPTEVARLHAIFRELDTNNDKALSREELRKGLHKLLQVSPYPCEMDVEALFEFADTDESDDLDFDELLVAMQRLRFANLDARKIWFAKFDKNGDLELTPDEIVQVLPRISLEEAKAIVGPKGKMSRNDFVDSWRSTTWERMYKLVMAQQRAASPLSPPTSQVGSVLT